MKVKCLIILCALFLLPANGMSKSYSVEFIIEQARKKNIPGVCEYMGVLHAGRTPTGRKLLKKYGPDWKHMHHYCWALVDLQRGKQREALDNLDYVLRNSKRNFALRPMVLSQKAAIFMAGKQFQKALAVYREMAEIKPDLEEGWVGMANVFIALKEYDLAREIVENGMKHVPNPKVLPTLIK